MHTRAESRWPGHGMTSLVSVQPGFVAELVSLTEDEEDERWWLDSGKR